ncbi:MAG: type IV secretory system conjugative DNA transfer family protein, partial [Longispora sp.]|nr:type IV secretory system conjugative DNA transfer family protein [Longispora sp. (in: high G+C Gram-positive bacteria)]
MPSPELIGIAIDGLPANTPLYFGGALAATAAAAVVAGLLSGRDKDHRRQERMRDMSSAWACPKDVADLVVAQRDPARLELGTLAGKTIANPPRRSLMVIAPTGAGKTPRVVIPTVLRHKG